MTRRLISSHLALTLALCICALGGGTFALAQGEPVAELSAPPGSVVATAASATPPGWLAADGSDVSRVQYAALFEAIGTTYGEGNGTTTFTLPDLQGRVPVGRGTHSDVDSLTDSDGDQLSARRPRHTHTVNAHSHTVNSHTHSVASHTHAFSGSTGATGALAYNNAGAGSGGTTWAQYNHTHAFSGTTGGGGGGSTGATSPGTDSQSPGTDAQGPAFQVVNYIIKH